MAKLGLLAVMALMMAVTVSANGNRGEDDFPGRGCGWRCRACPKHDLMVLCHKACAQTGDVEWFVKNYCSAPAPPSCPVCDECDDDLRGECHRQCGLGNKNTCDSPCRERKERKQRCNTRCSSSCDLTFCSKAEYDGCYSACMRGDDKCDKPCLDKKNKWNKCKNSCAKCTGLFSSHFDSCFEKCYKFDDVDCDKQCRPPVVDNCEKKFTKWHASCQKSLKSCKKHCHGSGCAMCWKKNEQCESQCAWKLKRCHGL